MYYFLEYPSSASITRIGWLTTNSNFISRASDAFGFCKLLHSFVHTCVIDRHTNTHNNNNNQTGKMNLKEIVDLTILSKIEQLYTDFFFSKQELGENIQNNAF